MIRIVSLALAFAAGITAPALAQAGSPLFRHIDLGRFGRVELGEVFSQADRIADRETTGVYRLRAGTFGGAAVIRVEVTEEGRVRSMHFDYDPDDADYDLYVANTTSSYGPPLLTTRQASDGGLEEVARWEDADTVLEVVRRRQNARVDVFVTMFDRHERETSGGGSVEDSTSPGRKATLSRSRERAGGLQAPG